MEREREADEALSITQEIRLVASAATDE